MAQCGEDPALDHLHADLVARLARPRRHHRHTIVLGQVAVAEVDVQLVAVRLAHCTAQVVRHHYLWHSAEEGEAGEPAEFGINCTLRRATAWRVSVLTRIYLVLPKRAPERQIIGDLE